jgi:hypothetical protein
MLWYEIDSRKSGLKLKMKSENAKGKSEKDG